MYWGDAKLDTIEAANLDGTGRRTILTETNDPHYYAFHLDEGFIYIADLQYKCVGLHVSLNVVAKQKCSTSRSRFEAVKHYNRRRYVGL